MAWQPGRRVWCADGNDSAGRPGTGAGAVRAAFTRLNGVDDVFRHARALSPRTIIFDVEPLVAHWDSGQEDLDSGIELVLGQADAVPGLRVVCFATNSARRPSATAAGGEVRVVWRALAGKPLQLAPYRDFPRPGLVVGDQVATDGVLARRLGYAFAQYRPPVAGKPAGPRLMAHCGRLVRPLLFSDPG